MTVPNRKTNNTPVFGDLKTTRVINAKSQRASREGKALLGGWVAEEVHTKFKVLSAKLKIDVQELLTEAADDLFKKYKHINLD